MRPGLSRLMPGRRGVAVHQHLAGVKPHPLAVLAYCRRHVARQLAGGVKDLDAVEGARQRVEGYAHQGVRVTAVAPVVTVPPLQAGGYILEGAQLPARVYQAGALDAPVAQVDVGVSVRIRALALQSPGDEAGVQVGAVVAPVGVDVAGVVHHAVKVVGHAAGPEKAAVDPVVYV